MLISTLHFRLHNSTAHLSNVLKLSWSFENQWNLSYWKYKIHKFYFRTNPKSTNLRIHELVIFNQTTKVDTHEEKYFHSRRWKSFLFICPLNLALRNFSYIVVVSFIGGGNRSTQRNPQVEDYARGCILQLREVKTIYRFHKWVLDRENSSVEYFKRAIQIYSLWQLVPLLIVWWKTIHVFVELSLQGEIMREEKCMLIIV